MFGAPRGYFNVTNVCGQEMLVTLKARGINELESKSKNLSVCHLTDYTSVVVLNNSRKLFLLSSV